MMRRMNSSRGSALLIVLGMMAFMVVSAVAFSFFMRQNRLPSSYLRRATALRQLAKASLAKAMKEIDDDIAGNPYPGVGGQQKASSSGTTSIGKNYWRGRVLCPEGLVAQEDTFPTMTLEGLAYLPPAIVNDVRYYARRTATAQWRRLDYDAGRYAFVVVNVSDFLDVNRLRAGDARSSANRISLETLFEDGTLRNFWSDPEDFQDFLDAARGDLPFVSIADYNLALKSVGGAGFDSPFVNYFVSGGGAGFYGFEDPPSDRGAKNYLQYGAQRFVTDSCLDEREDDWLRNSTVNQSLKTVSLASALNQPFDGFLKLDDDEKRNDQTANQVLLSFDSCPWGTERSRNIGPYEWVALYDYLDKDDVPTSVALPTVERAPMVVGVEQIDEQQLKVKVKEDDPNPNGVEDPAASTENTRVLRKTVTHHLEFDNGQIQLNVGLAFPFKYQKERNANRSYKVRAVGSLCLIPQAVRMLKSRTSYDTPAIGNWSTAASQAANLNDGVFALVSDTKTIKLPTEEITTEAAAVSKGSGSFHDVQLSFRGFDGANGKLKDEQYLARFNLKRTEVKDENGNWIPDPAQPDWVIDVDKGRPDYRFRAADFDSGAPAAHPAFGQDYVWDFTCAVKVYDDNDQLVDMAPASFADDMQPNQGGDFGAYHKNAGRPVLRFDGDGAAGTATVNLKEQWADMHAYVTGLNNNDALLSLKPMRYLTDDPRYNFAAENWYAADNAETGGSMGETWLKQVSTGSKDWKDRDVFMAVSNQGYLQDGTEFAFLPCAKEFDAGGDFNTVERGDGRIPAGRDNALHANLMWHTHDCIDGGANGTDALKLSAGGTGFRVNPYSDDEIVTRLPFVDTPYDWWAAGTNALKDAVKAKVFDSRGKTPDGKLDAALGYTFGPRSLESAARLDATKLVPNLRGGASETPTVAGNVMAALRGNGNWYDAWRNLDWEETGDRLCGVDGLGVTLHEVDRKFLYGYWRSCFANQQQLFIVFFRAEATMIGSGSGGASSAAAQMGARGVAVVWRDPRATTSATGSVDDDSVPPHRMRVLFYHQFD